MNSPIAPCLEKFYFPLVGNRMLELGNKKTNGVTYKSYFESLGIEHVSIDWNGLDGALKLDLRQPIAMEPFDMVTNIGTTEHVSDQAGVWANIHNLTKVGGVIISGVAIEGDWWWHGDWYPRRSFYEAFCLNGYEIELEDIVEEYPKRALVVKLRKTADRPFVMPPKNTIYHNIRRPRTRK